jgi:hypothetical protein
MPPLIARAATSSSIRSSVRVPRVTVALRLGIVALTVFGVFLGELLGWTLEVLLEEGVFDPAGVVRWYIDVTVEEPGGRYSGSGALSWATFWEPGCSRSPRSIRRSRSWSPPRRAWTCE